MSEPKKVDRRKFIGYGVAGAIAVVAAGTAIYYAARPPVEVVKTITATPETKVVTATVPAETVVRTTTVGGEETVITTTLPPKTEVRTELRTETVVGKPFEGKTIKIMKIAGGNFMEAGSPPFYREWEDRTGAKVEIIGVPFAELAPKIVETLSTGTYSVDLVVFLPLFIWDFVDYLEPLDDFINDPVKGEGLEWEDILPSARDNNTLEGKVMSIPVDGDTMILYFRKDLLSNEEYRSDFKNKFGYEMPLPEAGPRTWREFLDVGKFFNGWDWNNDGKIEFGTSNVVQRGQQAFFWFLCRVHSYMQLPVPGGVSYKPNDKYHGLPAVWFDADTMEPLVTEPGWVKAMEDELEQYLETENPADINTSLVDIFGTFPRGDVALYYSAGDGGPMELQKGNIGNLGGHNILPGAEEVWDRQQGKWVKVQTIDPLPKPGQTKEINFAPTNFAGGGWAIAMPKTARNKDAAWDFIKWNSGPHVSVKQAVWIGVAGQTSGVQPYRASHLEWDVWKAAGYYDINYVLAQGETFTHPNVSRELKIPGTFEYYDAVEVQLSNVLAEVATPKDALGTLYDEWKKITERKGLEKQRKFYRASTGLPP